MKTRPYRSSVFVRLATGFGLALTLSTPNVLAQPELARTVAESGPSIRVAFLGPSAGGESAFAETAESAERLGPDAVIAFERSDQPGVSICADQGVYELGRVTVVRWPKPVSTVAGLQHLAEMLSQTEADAVVVAIDRVCWVPEDPEHPDGLDWDAVHAQLARDTRVLAVLAVREGVLRDDGDRDGIRYLGLPPSSGLGPVGLERFSQPSIVMGIGNANGMRFAVVSPAAVHAADSAPGTDVDDAIALQRAVSVAGAFIASSDGGPAGSITVAIHNPTSRDTPYALAVHGPTGWEFDREEMAGTIAAGETESFKIAGVGPALLERPKIELRGQIRLPLSSGGSQAVPVSLPVTVSPAVRSESARGLGKDMALRLDSRSGVLIDHESRASPFTVECWVWFDPAMGDQKLMTAPGFELVWSGPSELTPAPAAIWSSQRHNPQRLAASGSTPRPAIQADGRPGDEPGDELMERWVHVALCVGPSKAVLFVDGDPIGSMAIDSEHALDAGPWVVGGAIDEFGRIRSGFAGLLDDVRVSAVVRYQEPFTPSRGYESDEQTVLLLRFDEQLGPVFADDSPAQSHGWGVGRARVEAVAPLP